jgi:hypothetical protein
MGKVSRFNSPPLEPVRCPACRRIDPSGSFFTLCMPPHKKGGDKKATIEVQLHCCRCRAVCMQLVWKCREDQAWSAFSALQGCDCAFRYWPSVMIAAARRVAPSVRPGTPADPISTEEIEQARDEINRATFRRTSREWRLFLKKFGIDGDAGH